MNNAELPAFANPGSEQGPGSSGLTKREYFAAMAMHGILANSEFLHRFEDADIHSIAVKNADYLLAELEKPKQLPPDDDEFNG